MTALLCAPFAVVADAKWVEPQWVKTRRFRLGTGKPTHRLIHFTDVHHKGDRAYLEAVVRKINALSPDFVCFTGDLIEETKHLAEALEVFAIGAERARGEAPHGAEVGEVLFESTVHVELPRRAYAGSRSRD